MVKALKSLHPGLTLIIAFFLVIVGFGVQSYYVQEDRKDYERCITKWASDRDNVANLRAEANAELDRVSLERSDTLDTLLLFALSLPDREKRTLEEEKEIRKRIDEYGEIYRRAVAEVRREATDANDTRTENPFPTLNC